MKRKTLFLDAINSMCTLRDTLEYKQLREVTTLMAKEAGMDNILTERSLYLPVIERSTLDTSSGGLVAEIPAGLEIPSLTNYLTLARAGARVYESASLSNAGIPDLEVPYTDIPAASAKAENADADEANITMGKLSFKAKRTTVYVDFSRTLLHGGPAAETYLINLLIAAVAAKFESFVLGATASSAIKPQGMFYKNTTGASTKAAAVVPSLANLLALEKAIDDNNALTGSIGWITSGTGARILKSIARETGQDTKLYQDGKMLEFPLYFTNNVPNDCGSDGAGSGLVLGNWQDLIITLYGGYIFTADPFVLAKKNQVRITVNQFADCLGARGTASTGEGTDADNYTSFARVSIKAS